jgi:hypothetical protein
MAQQNVPRDSDSSACRSDSCLTPNQNDPNRVANTITAAKAISLIRLRSVFSPVN